MKDRLKQVDRTLLEMITGILLYGVLCQLAGLLFPMNMIQYAVGLWIGILLAIFSVIHMWRSLNKAFACDEKSAARLISGGYMIRYLIIGAFLVLMFYTKAGYPLALFLGAMGIKTGAYSQPVLHKCYNKLFHESDPIATSLSEEQDASGNMDE